MTELPNFFSGSDSGSLLPATDFLFCQRDGKRHHCRLVTDGEGPGRQLLFCRRHHATPQGLVPGLRARAAVPPLKGADRPPGGHGRPPPGLRRCTRVARQPGLDRQSAPHSGCPPPGLHRSEPVGRPALALSMLLPRVASLCHSVYAGRF